MRTLEHPEGKRLPALERNILKFRAFEMMLSLFYAEELKQLLVSTLKVSEHWRDDGKKRFKKGTKFNYAMAADVFVKEGHLSKDERAELKTLIDFRNDIAHELHMMTFDVGRSKFTRQMLRIQTPKYDYAKLERLKHYRKVLPNRLGRRYGMEANMDRFYFEDAEKTYASELDVLAVKINRQIDQRKVRTERLKKETELGSLASLEPDDPSHFRDNGTLSDRGVEVCYRLFDAGKTPLAVAYLMHVSKRTTLARHKMWTKLGVVNRPKVTLPDRYPKQKRSRRRRLT
jgi:hypothetical protein